MFENLAISWSYLLVLSIAIFTQASLTTPGGGQYYGQIVDLSIIGFLLVVIMIIVRRPSNPTWLDLLIISLGYIPFSIAIPLLAHKLVLWSGDL